MRNAKRRKKKVKQEKWKYYARVYFLIERYLLKLHCRGEASLIDIS